MTEVDFIGVSIVQLVRHSLSAAAVAAALAPIGENARQWSLSFGVGLHTCVQQSVGTARPARQRKL